MGVSNRGEITEGNVPGNPDLSDLWQLPDANHQSPQNSDSSVAPENNPLQPYPTPENGPWPAKMAAIGD
jgi:hypothetical protein